MAPPAPSLSPSAGVSLTLALASREAVARGMPAVTADCLWLSLCRVAELARNPAFHHLSLPPETLTAIEHEAGLLLRLFDAEDLEPRQLRQAMQSYLPVALRSEDSLQSPPQAADVEIRMTNARARARSQGQTHVTLPNLAQAWLADPTAALARELLRAVPEPREASVRREAPATDAPPHTGLLDRLGRDLVPAARDGQLRYTLARPALIDELLRALAPDHTGCVILVGERGVGRTALVHGLARRISQGRVPDHLKGCRVIEVPGSALRGGADDADARFSSFDQVLREGREQPQSVLFVDDIDQLIRTTPSSPGRLSLTDLLLTALSGEPLMLLATVDAGLLDEEPLLKQAVDGVCDVLHIEEPSRDEAVSILSDCRNELEARYQLSVDDSAVEAAVELSARFIGDRRLPDKALDVLDDACAGRSLDTLVWQFSGPDTNHAFTAVADRIGVPRDLVAADQDARCRYLQQDLEQRLIGQGPAIVKIAGVLRSALNSGPAHQPLDVLLLVSEDDEAVHDVASAMARVMFGDAVRAVRFLPDQYLRDGLSERLLGKNDGPPGELTLALRRTPGAVVLMDGVEACTDGDLETLRHLLADAPLEDPRGRQVIRRGALFLLGARARDAVKVDRLRELLGADVHHVVHLRPADPDQIQRVAARLLARAQLRLAFAGRPMTLPESLADTAVNAIAQSGRICARQLEREIEREVGAWLEKPVQERTHSAGRITPPSLGMAAGATTTLETVLPEISAMLRSTRGAIHQLRAGPHLTIGRGDAADWTVFLVPRTVANDEATLAISRTHLLVRPTLRGFFLEPASSNAVTTLPHGPLTTAGSPVMPDMRISLGGALQLRLRLFHDQPSLASTIRHPAPHAVPADTGDDPDTASDDTAGDVPTGAVALFDGVGACRSLVMTRVNNRPGEQCVVLVGRCLIGSRDSEIVVDGAPTMAAEVVPAGPDRLQLRALATGLRVNDAVLAPGDPPHELQHGDTLAFSGTDETLTYLQRPRPEADS